MTLPTDPDWKDNLNSIANWAGQPKRKRKWSLLFLVILVVVFAGLYLLIEVAGVRVNLTSSMPKGIYQVGKIETLKPGMMVEVCLPDALASYAIERGYTTQGRCQNGSKPLLKELIAIPGDQVSVNQKGMTVNGRFYPAPQAEFDKKGRVLNHILLSGVLTEDYLVYGSGDYKHSWDSRYFGVLPKSSITGVVHE